MPFNDVRLPRRFWDKVTVKDTGCWQWIGAKDCKGYGRIKWAGRVVSAHRLAYETFIAAIPESLEPDHLCRNTGCVHPEHLELVTHRINVLRGVGPTARNARRTHCMNRHEFTIQNTLLHGNGGRRCRICKNAHHKEYKKRRKIHD